MGRNRRNRGDKEMTGQQVNNNGGSNRQRGMQAAIGGPDDQSSSNPRKRHRRSTGGMSSTPDHDTGLPGMSLDQFKALSTDDKLATMFGLLASVHGRVHSVNDRLDNCEANIESLMNETSDTNARVQSLEYHSIDSEARSRRMNLIFRGIPEILIDENCCELVTKFLIDDLELESAESIHMERAHRLGRPDRLKTRPIIVRFQKESDMKDILGKAHKLNNKPTKGVSRDYPTEIVQARSKLCPLYKDQRDINPKGTVFIGYPAKLIVQGKVIRNEFPDWEQVLKKPRVQPQPTPAPVHIPDASARGPPQQPVRTRNPFGVLSALNESRSSSHHSDNGGDNEDSGTSDVELDPYSQAMSQLSQMQHNPRAQDANSTTMDDT